MVLPAFAFAIALVPGLYRFYTGRHFRRADADPALAERWWTSRTRVSQVSFFSALVATALQPRWVALTLPVLLLGSTVGGFPARRAVFGESWSLPRYIAWVVRLGLGLWGFWIALAIVPWFIADRAVGWLAAAGLIAWQLWYGSLLRWSLGARRLDPAALSPELAQGFARVFDRSTAPTPDLWRAGPTESTLANAIALPALHRSSVLFSNALLEALSPPEITAILAHEVGHLEYFTRRRQAVLSVIVVAVIGAATLIVPGLPGAWLRLLSTVWPLLLLSALALRTGWQQAKETASDHRAVELCGDPDALAEGLIKLHALGRVPRRWSAAFERRASHPSLARRLAAIRGQAGAASRLGETTVIRGSDASTWVVIEPERIRHMTGVPAGTPGDPSALALSAQSAVSLAYSDVRDLRVVAPGGAAAAFRIGLDRGGSLTCPLQPGDVGRVQAALDRVDHLLAPPAKREGFGSLTTRALGVSVAVSGALFHTPSLVVLGVLTALLPAPGLALGLGLAGLLASGASFAGAPWLAGGGMSGPTSVAILALLCLWTAWRQPSHPPRRQWLVPAGLAAAAILVWGSGILLALNLLVLHRLALMNAAATLLPAALGGVLWKQAPNRRPLALSASLFALVPLLIASPLFTRYIIRDPWLRPAIGLRESSVRLEPLAEGPAPDAATTLQISSDGRHFVVGIDEDDEGDPDRYGIGTIGKAAVVMTADDVALVDDDRVLRLRANESGTTLSLLSIADGLTPVWEHSIDMPRSSRLFVDVQSKRWRVVGRTRTQVTRIESDVDLQQQPRVDRWQLSEHDRAYQWLVDDGPEILGLGWSTDRRWSRRYSLLFQLSTTLPMSPAALYVADARGVHQIGVTDQDVDCEPPPPGRPIVCLATDGGSTRLLRFAHGALQEMGELKGRGFGSAITPAGELTAWRGRERLFVDPVRGEVFTVPPRLQSNHYWVDWTSTGKVVAALASADGELKIQTFRRR